MTAFLGRGEESRKTPHHTEPLPADPTGQRLCEIFGHYRWQFIRADVPEDATAKPSWTTVTDYPLRPRALWDQWQDATQLIGVRFTHETYYALIDLDAGGGYSSAEGVAQIRAALETIGITRTLLIRSSWRNGLHLYIPLPELVNTFNLAVALKECLKAQGFQIKAGQLETFPNVKAYGVTTFTEYNAHRLPLQPGSGSCLLDDALNPQSGNLARFFWLWDGAAAQQDLDALRHALKIGRDNHRKRPKRRSHPVDTWRQDLDVEITEGWTAHGQTNHLLKTIACYGRVFEGLEGQALIDYTQRIAINSPGYEQYCRHQHEIEGKVTAWAKAVEGYYWPLGTTPSRESSVPKNNLVPFNQRQSEEAQHRICSAYRELEQSGTLPDQITARAKVIAQTAHVSQQTLYKHLSLWHPYHQQGVIDADAILSGDDDAILAAPCQAPEPLENKGLHPLAHTMKGGSPPQGEVGSDPNSFTPERGVRGDEPGFPQPPDPEHLAFLEDVATTCHRQAERLGWTAVQMGQFIADQFEGKRRWQLSDDELMTLMYRLQALESD
ncbi:MAG: hypothetical protein VKI82_10860 [Leptolyngbya sp.]|nr:hypothetical protein [Leptolyngbya sp.]